MDAICEVEEEDVDTAANGVEDETRYRGHVVEEGVCFPGQVKTLVQRTRKYGHGSAIGQLHRTQRSMMTHSRRCDAPSIPSSSSKRS